MTWENFGQWHLDHVKPCKSFNLENHHELLECFHWSNFRPLWKEENLKKSSKWLPDIIHEHEKVIQKYKETVLHCLD